MSIVRKSILAAQPTTLRTHPTHLSTDPKGERLAYASGKSVFLRSIDDPSLSTQYTSHTAAVNVARFSPSGYYIASGDASGVVRVWDAVGPDMITKGEFNIISGPINDVAWDGESKRIIAVGAGKDRYGHCITFDTGNSVGEILGHSGPINSVSIRQSRPYRAATASDDRNVVFFHGTPFKYNTCLTGHHSSFVEGVAFSPDGEHFVTIGMDRKIFLYNGRTGEFKTEINYEDSGHKGGVLSVSWSKDSKRFVTASADQTVKIWDLQSEKNSRTWKFGPEGLPSVPDFQVGVVWTPRDDNTIISVALSGDLNYLDFNSEKPRRIITGHQKAITSLRVVPEPKTLFSGSVDGKTCTWDLGKGTAQYLDGNGHSNNVSGFSQVSTETLASIGWDDHIRLIDVGAGTFVGTPIKTEGQPKDISTVGKDRTFVVVTEEAITAYSASEVKATLKPKYTPANVSGSTSTVEFAVGGKDNSLHIYTLENGTGIREKKVIADTRAAPTCLSYSPSGKYLAVGDSSGKITLYDVDAGYTVKTTRWSFHTARVESIVWNAQGTHVVTGSLDTNIFIYSVENPGRHLTARNAHMGGVNAVAWEGADTVVSAGADASVKRWEAKLSS